MTANTKAQLRARILNLPPAMRTKLFIEDETDGIECALYADYEGDIFVVPDEGHFHDCIGIVRLLPHIVVPLCYAFSLPEGCDTVDDFEMFILTKVVDESLDKIAKTYFDNLDVNRSEIDLHNMMFGF